MKKRSLVAAIAMLVVSAIVLTSSTYAWFSTNSSASAAALEARVTNNAGNLQVAATGDYAKTTSADQYKVAIGPADYEGYTTALVPCSMNLTSGSVAAPVFTTLTLAAAQNQQYMQFSNPTTAATTQYLEYAFKVQYQNNGNAAATITLAPTFNRTPLYTYALVRVSDDATGTNASYTLFGSDSYTPVTGFTSGTTAIDDADNDSILDAETGWSAGNDPSQLSGVQQGGNITFTANGNSTTTKVVTVYIWAEGNDAQCTGGANGLATTLAFAISAA